MTRAGRKTCGMRLRADGLAEGERLFRRRGLDEDPRMSDDPEEAAQDDVCDAVGLVSEDDALEPGAVIGVTVDVLAMGVDEDVDVREDQSWSIRSSSAALSSRSTPG